MTTKPTPVYYILHGTDEFSIKARVQKFRTDMNVDDGGDFNSTWFDGEKTPVREVLAAALASPFLGDKRLVIVEGMLGWLVRKGAGKIGKEELAALDKSLPQLPPTTRLIFAEYSLLANTHPIMQKALLSPDRAYVKQYDIPKGRDLVNWILKKVDEFGGQIEPRAAEALAAVVGENLRGAENECFKLVTYTGGARPISEADVELMTPYTKETVIWALTDALGKRDGRAASRALMGIFADDPKQVALGLLGMIVRHFRILLQVREVLDGGGNIGMLADIARLPPNVRGNYTVQARQFTLEQLEDVYRYLLKLDFDLKDGGYVLQGGDEAGRLALDLFVASVTD